MAVAGRQGSSLNLLQSSLQVCSGVSGRSLPQRKALDQVGGFSFSALNQGESELNQGESELTQRARACTGNKFDADLWSSTNPIDIQIRSAEELLG